MRDADCIFCKIIGGEIPSNTIYEDDEFKVILDASPASKGHALILPKEHYADIYEIDEKTAGHAMQLAKKLAKHMTDVLKCDGFNIVQNNHEIAGQTVFHFHMHLIPRYKNAKNNDILIWDHEEFTPEEMAEIRDSLKMQKDCSKISLLKHSYKTKEEQTYKIYIRSSYHKNYFFDASKISPMIVSMELRLLLFSIASIYSSFLWKTCSIASRSVVFDSSSSSNT